jgi:hypothetical protein
VSATGFIYVVPSVGTDYQQPSLQQVPTWFEDRIYFGPCKIPMRPRMNVGDYIFGISPSGPRQRRVIFAARIAEKMTFAEAHARFPKLRGPIGPIHVRPTRSGGLGFPHSHYEHIPGANHPGNWSSDLRVPKLDVFFACERAEVVLGRWLGRDGPVLTPRIVEFLRTCELYGKSGALGPNASATDRAPVKYGRLFTGLHAETSRPESFLRLIADSIADGEQSGELQRTSAENESASEQPYVRRRRGYRCRTDPGEGTVLLVRVGADQTDGGGGWNGPIDSRTGRFVYVPIPEAKSVKDGLAKPYSMLGKALASLGQVLPPHLCDRWMHLDPDFKFLTYGDRGAKGRQIESTLIPGDLIVFYAGLRAVNQNDRLVYAMIGMLSVDMIVKATEIRSSEWHRNAHTRRELPMDADDIVVLGSRRGSGRLSRAITIGEYRSGAYRVTESLLRVWGGLSARGGYLQRSAVFPSIRKPGKFHRWFSEQSVDLLAENNPEL